MASRITDRPAVHVTEEIHPAAVALLERHARVTHGAGGWAPETQGLIVRNRRITAEEIAATPALRVIGKHGVGTDAIDCTAARAAGVDVVTTPGANARSVAQHALAMALSLVRELPRHDAALRRGAPVRLPGFELDELTAGIIGLGNIGGEVARLLSIFDAPRAAYDPYLPQARWVPGVSRAASLEELLAVSDLLFVHVPLAPDTRNMLGAEALAQLPKGAFVVNCARGGIVDEAALARALESGHLAGAASDVFEVEPPPKEHPLLRQPNFIATPHVAASTDGGLQRVGRCVVQKVLGVLGIEAGGADGFKEEEWTK